jgi:hypothetical protein
MFFRADNWTSAIRAASNKLTKPSENGSPLSSPGKNLTD